MYVLSIATKDELLQNTKDAETSRKAWNKVAEIFARANDSEAAAA